MPAAAEGPQPSAGNAADPPAGTRTGPRSGDALAGAVADVERFVHASGWRAPRQIFALVRTEELLAHEPGLIGHVGGGAGDPGHGSAGLPEYTPVEQADLPGETVADALTRIIWPDTVAGCVLVLPIATETAGKPAEGRLAVGVIRGRPGGRCALRWRHAPDGPVTYSPDLAPELIDALHATFAA